MILKRPTTKEKEEKGESILLCGNKLLISNSKKSKCDFCGVSVYYNTEERHDKKICPKCFLNKVAQAIPRTLVVGRIEP